MLFRILLLLFAFTHVLNAQHNNFIDSIADLIANASTDSMRTSHYYDASRYALMTLGDLELMRKYNDSTMYYAIKSGHTKLEAQTHFAYGLLERLEGNYDKALDHLNKNITYFKDDSLMKPYALFQVGVIYRQTGQLEKGLQTYLEILGIFEHRSDTAAMASTLNSIANLYGDLGQYEDAVAYFRRARALFEQKNIRRDISNSEISLAEVYLHLKNKSEAIKYANSGLSIAQEINYPQLIGRAYHLLGNIYFEDDIDTGMEYLKKAESILDSLDFTKDKLALWTKLGMAYYSMGDYSAAKNYLLKTLDDAREKQVLSEVQKSTEALAEIYFKESKFKKAYEYRLQFEAAKDSVLTIEKIKNINLLQEQFETEQKDRKLVQQELEITRRTSERNRAYTGVLSVLALGAFFFYRNHKNRKLSATKIENLEKQQKLMALDYIVQGQEAERKRIAQDLHDGLGGLLTTAHLQIQNVQNEIDELENLNLLQTAESLIDDACMEVRRISHDMMPGALIDLGLQDALDDLSEKFMSENDLQISIIDKTTEIHLNDNQKVQFYRIIQELLNNTVKHAEAQKVQIIFTSELDNTLQLRYSDDGKGFMVSEYKYLSGIGLKNIESRVKYLNGISRLDSQIGKGTNYTIVVPLK